MDKFDAEERIDSDLRAGAISEYVDGETALEVLGDLLVLFNKPAPLNVNLIDHLRAVNLEISGRLSAFQDKIVADNIAHVIAADDEEQRDSRSTYFEMVSEKVH